MFGKNGLSSANTINLAMVPAYGALGLGLLGLISYGVYYSTFKTDSQKEYNRLASCTAAISIALPFLSYTALGFSPIFVASIFVSWISLVGVAGYGYFAKREHGKAEAKNIEVIKDIFNKKDFFNIEDDVNNTLESIKLDCPFVLSLAPGVRSVGNQAKPTKNTLTIGQIAKALLGNEVVLKVLANNAPLLTKLSNLGDNNKEPLENIDNQIKDKLSKDEFKNATSPQQKAIYFVLGKLAQYATFEEISVSGSESRSQEKEYSLKLIEKNMGNFTADINEGLNSKAIQAEVSKLNVKSVGNSR